MTDERPNSRYQSILQANAIALSFDGAAPLVDGFELELAPNAITTIIGPSGVGKSSLLKVLSGLSKPQAGSVLVEGRLLDSPQPQVAIAFQHAALLPWLNVRENVQFGLNFGSQSRVNKRQIEQQVTAAIDEVGLHHAQALFPDQISGGMAQRAALARCLAREPRVLLLDEPFGALDEITRKDMQQLLLKTREKHQIAVLLITHDIDEALLVSDQVILLAGTPANIKQAWTIPQRIDRDLLSPEMIDLRVQMLRAMRLHVRTNHSPSHIASDSAHRSHNTATTVTSTTTQTETLAHVL